MTDELPDHLERLPVKPDPQLQGEVRIGNQRFKQIPMEELSKRPVMAELCSPRVPRKNNMHIKGRKRFQAAIIAAHKAHAGQEYGGVPYTRHLAHVVNVLQIYSFSDPILLTAGWLHDVIEDTDYTLDRLANEFGTEIAELVWAVTDGEGKNRKERKEASYLKMQMRPLSIVLKLADRIANVEATFCDDGNGLLDMYRKEQEYFKEKLYRDSMTSAETARYDVRLEKMWAYLEYLLNKGVTRA